MKEIPLSEIPESLYKIFLQNGQEAEINQVILTIVPEVNKEKEIMVYKYNVPCPVCGHHSIAFSYDGKTFANVQMNCRYCGVFFRPVIKRN